MPNSIISIFSGSNGLNTKVDPARIRFDPKTGISDFAATVNIDIDDTGRPSRRDGYTSTARTETWHSLFGCGNYGIGVTGDALCIIEHDLSYTPIRHVMVGARMSYVKASDGEQEVIYYANGFETGRILGKRSYAWPVGTYVGPETRKAFYAAPVGHLVEIRNLRMFIAQDHALWYSEPGAYSLWRLAASYFAFSSRIRMVQAVAGGLWVSDSESIYWLGGEISPSALEMPVQIKKADYPVIESTAVKVPGSRIGSGEAQGEVVVFATTEGLCAGLGDGTLLNLTERKVDIPSGLTGAGYYRDSKYVCTID